MRASSSFERAQAVPRTMRASAGREVGLVRACRRRRSGACHCANARCCGSSCSKARTPFSARADV
eukprot:409871-Pleurochrysis_carterae.AAC.2